VIDSEDYFVTMLARTLRTEGYRVRLEVPNMGQSVDLVATRGRWVTAIEAKLRDWPRAVSQCRAHEAVADFICVAIATLEVPVGLADAAESSGYGIIHYTTETGLEWVLRPRQNRLIWIPQRQRFAEAVRRVSYAD
jgi:hypothetical protein